MAAERARANNGRYMRTIVLRPSKRGSRNRKTALHMRQKGARRVKGQIQGGYAPIIRRKHV